MSRQSFNQVNEGSDISATRRILQVVIWQPVQGHPQKDFFPVPLVDFLFLRLLTRELLLYVD